MEISLKAYGKINLGLDVVRRREDGYHEVKMIMQTVDLWDELTFCDVTTDEIVITSDSSERHVTLDAKIRRGGTLGPVPRTKEIPHHRDA